MTLLGQFQLLSLSRGKKAKNVVSNSSLKIKMKSKKILKFKINSIMKLD